MSYVKKNLMSGEVILYEAKIHWSIYTVSIYAFIGIFLVSVDYRVTACIVFMVIFLITLMARRTTELVITSKRMITKQGFISRKTTELKHSKIELLEVKQSICERLLNAGTIILHGTGGNKQRIKYISDPLMFRRVFMETTDNA